MNAFKLFLLSLVWIPAHSSVMLDPSNHRRHLLAESSCTLLTEYTMKKSGETSESWVCELSKEESSVIGIDYVDIDDSNPQVADIIKNATNGETLTFTKATVSNEEIHFPETSLFDVQQDTSTMEMGDVVLASTDMPPISPDLVTPRFGTLSVLMIRVTTNFEGESREPKPDKQELSDVLFAAEKITNDRKAPVSLAARNRKAPASFATQMETCSFGQVKLVPFEGNMPSGVEVTDGVVELTVDNFDIDSKGKIRQATREAARQAFGEDYRLSAHLILYCMPKGKHNRAFAVRNKAESFYVDKGCVSLGSYMHEVGHSMGNGHSGSDIDGPGERTEYGDFSGEMGKGTNCYNPPKNFAIGWYANQTATFDPLDGTGTRDVLLNGFTDFAENDDALVSVRLETPFSQECEEDLNCQQYDYFIGFNYATGINEYSRIQGDEVWVGYAKKNDPQGDSWYVALLSLGESYKIEDFDGNGSVVTILFSGLANGGDATVQIIDGAGPSQPPPQPFNCVDSDDTFPFGDNDSYSCEQLPSYEPALEAHCIGKKSSSEDAARLRANCPSSCCFQCGADVNIMCEKPPTASPTEFPTDSPTSVTTGSPTESPTASPTVSPTESPTASPTPSPTASPTESPTGAPTALPTVSPTKSPTLFSDVCFDVPSSEWTYRGKENQGCEWIAEKPLKRQKPFCKKRANEDTEDKRRVSVYCGETCFLAGDKDACK